MDELGFRRARLPAQRRVRRNAILAAAERLLEGGGVDSVSLNAIAECVGCAKSNLYRYFESREEIFLELLLDDWGVSADTLERELAPLAGSNNPEAVAQVLAQLQADRPRLGHLVSVLSSVLEQNISEDLALRFKTSVRGLSIRQANALHAALPVLTIAECAAVGQISHALLAGFWPMANPAPAVRTVLERPEFAGGLPQLPDDLEAALHVVLVGSIALAQSRRSTP